MLLDSLLVLAHLALELRVLFCRRVCDEDRPKERPHVLAKKNNNRQHDGHSFFCKWELVSPERGTTSVRFRLSRSEDVGLCVPVFLSNFFLDIEHSSSQSTMRVRTCFSQSETRARRRSCCALSTGIGGVTETGGFLPASFLSRFCTKNQHPIPPTHSPHPHPHPPATPIQLCSRFTCGCCSSWGF